MQRYYRTRSRRQQDNRNNQSKASSFMTVMSWNQNRLDRAD